MPNGFDNPYVDEQTGFFDIMTSDWGSLAELGQNWMPGGEYWGGQGTYGDIQYDEVTGEPEKPWWILSDYWDPSEIGQAIGFDVLTQLWLDCKMCFHFLELKENGVIVCLQMSLQILRKH